MGLSELMAELEGLKRRHAEILTARAQATAAQARLQAERGAVLLAGERKAIDANGREGAQAAGQIADADAMLVALAERLETSARAIWEAEEAQRLALVAEFETVRLPAAVAETQAALAEYRRLAGEENALRVTYYGNSSGLLWKDRRAELLQGVSL